ncbi:YDG domain-containing protein [Janthinobacterium sp. SUN211]|uniref:YDG domain-containing protein n=1 Tax=Janthinobacterium sp. SUN211 TaxID=3014786 RepID=UPI00271390E8|nr:YDG domain-containing protein [Janthinobacterium sp. SUN211]MDO8049139.1 YDG domain-containing protein [Janthinobacterium sp. SUN211]
MHRHGSLNHIYRLVWSHVLNAWVAVAETSRGRGKSSRRKLAAAAAAMTALALGGPAQAAPTGGQVVSGTASISQQGGTTTIHQGSAQAALNWNSFNVGAKETVNFVQPSASALAVNRIFDSNGTQILGRVNANGQVYLINPNGVLFGRGAQVNVGGLVASTLDVDSASLGGSKHAFGGQGTGKVVNEGTLRAADGGYVALLGRQVSNQGAISARLGTVALGAGSAATLSFDGARLLQLRIEQSTLNNLAENGGLIRADGGQVLMSAGARDSLLASVVNHTGVIEARSVEQRDGSIILLGGMAAGTTHVSGTLDASAPAGGNGGFIETSAAHVKIGNDTRISTAAAQGRAGTWLIDPVDFTIAASGGDISGAALTANLRNGNVVIQSTQGSHGTAGDVHVNDQVSWSANELTLNAQRNININANLNGSGTASLALEYGQGAAAAGNTAVYQLGNGAQVSLPAGQNFSTKLGADGVRTGYTVITQLGAYRSVTGTDLQGINGKLNGNFVLGADIDASATASAAWNPNWWDAGFVPLGRDAAFGGIFDGLGHSINQLSMMSGSGGGSGLFSITTKDALIQNVGLNGGRIKTHYYAGGLVGDNKGTIKNSYAALDVIADGFISGGLVARNSGTIVNSYASGAVSSNTQSGGLVGINQGTISNSYATGSVAGKTEIGGLVGTNWGAGSVNTSYAAGRLLIADGGTNFGGLIGSNSAPQQIRNSFWSIDGTGQATSKGGTGLTDTQMRTASSFTGFNFTTTPGAQGNNWVLVNVDGNLNNAGHGEGGTYPMLASEYSTTIYNAHQLQLMSMALNGSYVLGANIDASATAGGKGVWGKNGFIPVGMANGLGGGIENIFTGSLNGQSHTISGLTIASDFDIVGLFGYADSSSVISNIGLLGGSISGVIHVGALAGYGRGLISNSYSSATVNGRESVGGLLGTNDGNINNSYASGAVSGSTSVGGLIGLNMSGTVENTYATGMVKGETSKGALIGTNFSQVNNSFWTSTDGVSGIGSGGGSQSNVHALSDAQLHSKSSFGGWDMATNAGSGAIWRIYEGQTAPLLRSFLTALTVTSDAVSKTYDGQSYVGSLSNARYSIAGAADSGQVFSSSNSVYGAIRDAGLYNAAGTYLYSGQQGYDIDLQAGALTINRAVISLNGTRTYDGSASMAAGLLTLNGLVQGESLLLSGNGILDNKNAGGKKTMANGTLTLADGSTGQASNYTLEGGRHSATVNRATLNVQGVGAANKVYDASTGATLTGKASVQALGDDQLNVSGGTARFADKNAGMGKAVTLDGFTLQGADAANYVLVQPNNVTADISKASVVIAGVGAANKVYDATTGVILTGKAKVLALGGDQLSVAGGVARFADKNAGKGKAVIVDGYSLQGADAGNYVLVQPNNITADIGKASVVVAGVGAANKVYDATTGATLTGKASVQALGDDQLNVSGGTARFADKNAGMDKTVTLDGFALQGADAANYDLVQPGKVTADISKATVSVSGVGAANKVYDATTGATLTGKASVLALGGDQLSVAGGVARFADKNAGMGKTVTLSGFALQGADAANYDLVQPGKVTADISKATVSVSGVGAANKVYDATTGATLTGKASVLALGDDQLSVAGGTARFADKHAGTGKNVIVDGYTLQGADAGNYALVQPGNITADIAKASLLLTATATSLTGGRTPKQLSGTVSGLLGSDTLADATSGALAWTSPATASSPAGNYAIMGSGLASNDYAFVQAEGNAGALTLKSASLPPPAQAAVVQLQAQVLGSFADTRPGTLAAAPTITVTQTDAPAGTAAASNALPNTSMQIGSRGPALQVVLGGVKLPANMLNVNQ